MGREKSHEKLKKLITYKKAYVPLHSSLNWASQLLPQSRYYAVTRAIVYCVNQWTGFYIIATLDWMGSQNYNKWQGTSIIMQHLYVYIFERSVIWRYLSSFIVRSSIIPTKLSNIWFGVTYLPFSRILNCFLFAFLVWPFASMY